MMQKTKNKKQKKSVYIVGCAFTGFCIGVKYVAVRGLEKTTTTKTTKNKIKKKALIKSTHSKALLKASTIKY